MPALKMASGVQKPGEGPGDHPVPIEKAGPAGVGFILLELGFPGAGNDRHVSRSD